MHFFQFFCAFLGVLVVQANCECDEKFRGTTQVWFPKLLFVDVFAQAKKNEGNDTYIVDYHVNGSAFSDIVDEEGQVFLQFTVPKEAIGKGWQYLKRDEMCKCVLDAQNGPEDPEWLNICQFKVKDPKCPTCLKEWAVDYCERESKKDKKGWLESFQADISQTLDQEEDYEKFLPSEVGYNHEDNEIGLWGKVLAFRKTVWLKRSPCEQTPPKEEL